ncbi:MAG: dTDP-4-dehydrorhamnose reductase [Lachnospiraceae bacterium]|nr:dTDP-4-dehydrorhamnose reductase [Lachnospiraceae bacterium]
MKKIIVTGCNGQLGRAINRVYAGESDYELINTDFGIEGIKSLDISDIDSVMSFVKEVRPYAIINCAAMTAVDLCETKQDMAYRINAIGPRNLAIASSETGAELIHVSTDYVFCGDGSVPYTEFDPVGPVSMYGRTKLAGEEFVRQMTDRSFIIRTAWLYGDGKNFVKTMLRLSEDHDEVTVVDDQIGSPTSSAELASAIKSLVSTNNYGLFHGTCEGKCSWADFTEEIFRLAGKPTRVKHVSSDEYKQMNPNSADRPKFSVLENYMFKLTGGYQFADWHDAISRYISEL